MMEMESSVVAPLQQQHLISDIMSFRTKKRRLNRRHKSVTLTVPRGGVRMS